MLAFQIILYPVAATVCCCGWQLVAFPWKWLMLRRGVFPQLPKNPALARLSAFRFVVLAPLLGIPIGIASILSFHFLPAHWFQDAPGDLPGDAQFYGAIPFAALLTGVWAESLAIRSKGLSTLSASSPEQVKQHRLGTGAALVWGVVVTLLTTMTILGILLLHSRL